jgi:hypothetical protein
MVFNVNGFLFHHYRYNARDVEQWLQDMEKGGSALFGSLVASSVHKSIVECQVECPGNLQ